MDTTALEAMGFEVDEDARSQAQADADALGMSLGQPYNVAAVLTRRGVTVLVEQNVAAESAGGLDAVISYPAVARVSSPKGEVACAAGDAALIDAVATDLE
jgi:hypothetical protein